MSRDSRLEELLIQHWPQLPTEARERVLQFQSLLEAENKVQNLTRLVSGQDFWDGHVRDVQELINAQMVEYPAMDMGSGCGVPGLLHAAITGSAQGRWVLAESEGHKAEFLKRAVEALGLAKNVEVFSGRAENYLRDHRVNSIVARAVGPIERIMGWIHGCSTWNNLVLLKGPAWSQEWETLKNGRYKKRLEIKKSHSYTVGADQKTRLVIKIMNVPRGT